MYKKISIIGGSGTGKTTLANKLSKDLNIKVYHLDSFNYKPNWEQRDKEERNELIRKVLNKKTWITDGTYRETLLERLQKSDLIIYLDYSTISQIKGILTRYLKNKNKEKDDIPGCKEQMNIEFFIWVLKWRKNKRKDIINSINKIDKNKVIIFKTRKQLHKWYKNTMGVNYEDK